MPAVANWRMLLRQDAWRAFSRAWANTGNRIAARMAMMAMTTSSAISVKPIFLVGGMWYLPPLLDHRWRRLRHAEGPAVCLTSCWPAAHDIPPAIDQADGLPAGAVSRSLTPGPGPRRRGASRPPGRL